MTRQEIFREGLNALLALAEGFWTRLKIASGPP